MKRTGLITSGLVVLALVMLVVPLASAGTITERLSGKPLRYDITDSLSIELPGYYRFRFTHLGSITLSQIPSGERAGERQTLSSIDFTEHRWRLEPKVTFLKKLSFNAQLDVLTGMLSGNTSDRPDLLWYAEPEQRWNRIDGAQTNNYAELHLKRFWGSWESPVGTLRAGRQGSDWGTGMLVNDGTGFRNDFGDAYYGDNVDRVLFGTKPYSIVKYLLSGEKPENDPVTIAFAYDWNVARDANSKRGKERLEARYLRSFDDTFGDLNDQVEQFVGAIRVETAPFEGGFYIARREMTRPNNGLIVPPQFIPVDQFLNAWAFDLYGKLTLKPSFVGDGEIFIQGEGSRITGETNITISQIFQDPIANPFPVSDISQWGGVLRAGFRNAWIEAKVETGYASGDSNPFDDQVKNFKFHPDYNVGMILFEDVIANVTAASAFNAVNKFGEGGPVPPSGANLFPTKGSVTNAIYVMPTVKVYPIEGLEGIFNVLWARTAADWVDPAIDGLFGGGAGVYNPYGGPASNRTLGWEINMAASYTWAMEYLDVVFGVQYGHFFPGSAFENGSGERIDDVDKVQGRLTLIW